MWTQYSVLGYKIDLYFHGYKLAVPIDQLGHNVRDIDYETQRQKVIEKELHCVLIRIPMKTNLTFLKP